MSERRANVCLARDNRRMKIHWTSAALSSREDLTVTEADDGWRLAGVVTLPIDDAPGRIVYEVSTDHEWRTRSAKINVQARHPWTASIEVDSGRWRIDGVIRPDLDGCIDVDLGFTPATNMLPLRRLDLQIESSAAVDAAWLRFPEFCFQRSAQQYTRLDESRWLYSSGGYQAILETDARFAVVRYGDDVWLATCRIGGLG